MLYQITPPESFDATFSLPASKSISNRMLLMQALSAASIQLHNLSDCDDTQAIQRALQRQDEVIDIGAAGTAMRFLTAYFSEVQGKRLLTGTARMKQRPIAPLVEALRKLGASISYTEKEGYPPLLIEGTELQSMPLEVEASISSQFISALMMIGPTLPHGLHLTLKGEITSRPYIELTMALMQQFGICIEQTSEHAFMIQPGTYREGEYTIENDWSAASYAYELVALSPKNSQSSLTLHHLQPDSLQGDCSIQHLFHSLGVVTDFTDDGIRLSPTGQTDMLPLIGNLNDMPDMVQTLAVTCCLLNKPFHFAGLASLRLKETDRLSALCNELKKLGYALTASTDALHWDGSRCAQADHPIIETYNDHRMALAFAPASLRFPRLHINHPEVVSKSFPQYWQELQKLGFSISPLELPPFL